LGLNWKIISGKLEIVLIDIREGCFPPPLRKKGPKSEFFSFSIITQRL